MKCTKGSRRRRKIYLENDIVGPHVILKVYFLSSYPVYSSIIRLSFHSLRNVQVVKEDDSFYQFSERYEDDKNWQWKEVRFFFLHSYFTIMFYLL